MMAQLFLALLHYPVLNRMGEIIASAITNLDLHDLARSCRTYGVPACYIVTPLRDQQALANRLTAHWIEGRGGEILPERREAMKLLRVVESLSSAIRGYRSKERKNPGPVGHHRKEWRGCSAAIARPGICLKGKTGPFCFSSGQAGALRRRFSTLWMRCSNRFRALTATIIFRCVGGLDPDGPAAGTKLAVRPEMPDESARSEICGI